MRWRENTSGICYGYILCSTFSVLTRPHHTNRNMHKKEYSEVMIKEMLQKEEFAFLHCRPQNQLTIYVKINFHFVKVDSHNNKVTST